MNLTRENEELWERLHLLLTVRSPNLEVSSLGKSKKWFNQRKIRSYTVLLNLFDSVLHCLLNPGKKVATFLTGNNLLEENESVSSGKGH